MARRAVVAATALIPRTPGTYAIHLRVAESVSCVVGALGRHTFPAGDYIYVGSAWGPGGLAARVGRHLRGSGKRHWHIDYLRPYAHPVEVWLAPQVRSECAWAQALLAQPAAQVIVPRFGASDCTCATHLIYGVEAVAESLSRWAKRSGTNSHGIIHVALKPITA